MAKTKRQPRTDSDSKQVNGMSTDSRMSAAAADDIARRAYELYEERGCEHGRDFDDWLLAEHELRVSTRSTCVVIGLKVVMAASIPLVFRQYSR